MVSISTGAAAAAGAGAGRSPDALALALRERIVELVRGVSDFPAELMSTLLESSPTGSALWHVEVLLLGVAFALVGYGVARVAGAWSRNRFLFLFDPNPRGRRERIFYLLVRALLQCFNVVVYASVAAALVFAFDPGDLRGRQTQLILIAAAGLWWTVHIVFANILAYDTPSHRMVNITDASAGRLHRQLMLATAVSLAAVSVCAWMLVYGLNEQAHLLLLIGSTLLAALLLSLVALAHRKTVALAILGPGEEQSKPAALRLLARNWHVLAIVYFASAWTLSAIRLLLDLPSALGLVMAPLAVTLAAVTLYAALLLIIDTVAARRRPGMTSRDAAPVHEDDGASRHPLHVLAGHAAAVAAWLFALWMLLWSWGVDVSSEHSRLVGAADIFIVIVLAYLGYKALALTIDHRIAQEGGYEVAEPGEEGSGGAASRLATLLPLFRNFLLITVLVIAGMILLSQLGVDIAPLFAGAGVIGLAIGFGSQALIRDIFSGAFFLMDDAFRLGEYIDLGGTKGTVEKISIRSMQLRHHLGALHTVPFGEIKQLTNYSRDWAMMKLELRVTYDTDVEKVRKLIKNLGQELLADPEVGHQFLQPLKSQGVKAMEDSAMILRVKFMTHPGEQFVIRKMVYARIRELFEREGIKFAHREVTVRVSDGAQRESAAAAGGARALEAEPGDD